MANLLQIQDDLKSLPNDPRTMQALMSYANGANPMVPPYLALGELNRRKQLLEKQQMEQAGQPPQGTVKDQVEQQAGIMALQQQQAMPQGMPMPQAMPQGMPMQPAGGGLMSLMGRGYGSGGMVAFAESGEVEGDEEDDLSDVSMSPDEVLREAIRGRKLAQKFVAGAKAPTAETPMAFRKRMIEENPEQYGYLKSDEGQDVLSRLDEFQAAKRAELAKQRQEAESLKPGVLQLLARQAMQTGGMGGRQALARMLGGYGEAQMSENAKAIEREQAIRAGEIKLQEDKMLTINKVQELKRARDEGDIKAEQKALMDLAKIAKDHNTTVGNLIGKVVTASSSLAGRIGAAEIGRKGKVEAANISARAAAADRPVDYQRKYIELINAGKTQEAEKLLTAVQAFSGAKKPGLDMELLKKFEGLPGVKNDLELLNIYRTKKNPKPDDVTKMQEIEQRLLNKARANNINPSQIGLAESSSQAPQVGTVQDGYRFKGGDPSKQSNWEKV